MVSLLIGSVGFVFMSAFCNEFRSFVCAYQKKLCVLRSELGLQLEKLWLI